MNITRITTGPLGVNTYLIPIYQNKIIIVDPASCKFSKDQEKITDYISNNQLEPIAIVLTHGHFDHVSGLPHLKNHFPEIPIAIHEGDLSMIGKNSSLRQKESLENMGFQVFLPYVSQLPEASHLLKDKQNLAEIFTEMREEAKAELSKWTVIYTPGHTQGCICLYNEKDKILISGDTLFYHSWGRTDLPGGNERQIHESLKKILDSVDPETLVYPGHDISAFKLRDGI